MKLAKALGNHIHPMMVVFPLGMLGIMPALTLLLIAFGLVFIAGWLGGMLVERLGVGEDPQAGIIVTGGLGDGPTRW